MSPTSPSTNPAEQAFLEALRSNPADDDTRRVYADWLDEQGRRDHAEYIRLNLRIDALAATDPMRGELQRRVDRMRPVLPKDWRTDVTASPRPPEPEPAAAKPPGPRDPKLPLPPRPPEHHPLPPSRPVAAAPAPAKIPMQSVAASLFGLPEEPSPASPRRPLRPLPIVMTLVGFALLAHAFVDDLRWQAQDDNFVTHRSRGCSR